MQNQVVKHAIVTTVEVENPTQIKEYIAFFNEDGTPYDGLPTDAAGVEYDNGDSNLDAEDVQAAIDEVVATADTLRTEFDVVEAKLPGLVTTATAIGTAAKTTASAEPPAGSIVAVKFTNGNSAEQPTLNFAAAGARAIKLAGTATDADQITIAANGVALFYFDGTVLHQIGLYSQV